MTTQAKKPADKRAPARMDRFKGLAQQLQSGGTDSRLMASELSSSLGFLLRVASGVATDKFARRLEASGLRQTLYTLLVVIDDNPGLKQQEVGQILSIQQPNLVALVNELVEKGFISRAVNVDDRRSYSLTLTSAGADAVRAARAEHAGNEAALAAAVAPMSLEDFRAVLRRVIGVGMVDA